MKHDGREFGELHAGLVNLVGKPHRAVSWMGLEADSEAAKTHGWQARQPRTRGSGRGGGHRGERMASRVGEWATLSK